LLQDAAPAEGGEAPAGDVAADVELDLNLDKKKWVTRLWLALRMSAASPSCMFAYHVIILTCCAPALMQEEEEEGGQSL
jgi:hypothetical protein